MNFINGQPENKGSLRVYEKIFTTLFFNDRFSCNYFLEENPSYGYLGTDETGKIHCAKLTAHKAEGK